MIRGNSGARSSLLPIKKKKFRPILPNYRGNLAEIMIVILFSLSMMPTDFGKAAMGGLVENDCNG
jgi:hypothetical protein